MVLTLLGAVGFLVVVDLWRLLRGDAEGLGFSSTVILRIFPVLVLGGALLLALAEPSIAALPTGERVLASLFQSVNAATTAGFNSIPIAGIAPAGAIVLIVLMVIGAAPASTSGGLKVTTFAALWGLVGDVVAGRHAVAIFGRRIGEDRLRLATASLCYYLALATVATFALAITEGGTPLGKVAFEVISCLSTVGLSQGLTAEVSTPGQVILILLMFAGRVGLITFAIAIALPPGHEPYEEGHDLLLFSCLEGLSALHRALLVHSSRLVAGCPPCPSVVPGLGIRRTSRLALKPVLVSGP